MSEEKKSAFKVSDRRKFTFEGELKPDVPHEPEQASPGQVSQVESAPQQEAPPPQQQAAETAGPEAATADLHPDAQQPHTPTPEERTASHDAYRQSAATLESELQKEYGSQISREFEVTFDRILEPFYVTALMQLGVMGQEGQQRRVDIVGARQTIDTLTMLHDKMKGNLSPEEENLIQTMLYQLRLTYVDISNAVARSATYGQPGAPGVSK